MTDTPPPAAPEPTPPPAYSPAPGSNAPVAAKKTFAIVGFILGIASIVLSGFGILSIPAAIVGIVFSILARTREPGAPNWMKLLGLIFSIVGIVLTIVWIVLAQLVLANLKTQLNG